MTVSSTSSRYTMSPESINDEEYITKLYISIPKRITHIENDLLKPLQEKMNNLKDKSLFNKKFVTYRTLIEDKQKEIQNLQLKLASLEKKYASLIRTIKKEQSKEL